MSIGGKAGAAREIKFPRWPARAIFPRYLNRVIASFRGGS